jgi:glycosyltransferase involved in cell wall biosynthesis
MNNLISIVTPTKNEAQNIEKLSLEIKKIFENLKINYEQIIIDNNSTDGTVTKIKSLAKNNSNIKVILNESDYGQIRSPFYGMLQSNGDAVILITSDFQTPLELIPRLISKWKLDKNKVIFTKRISSEESLFIKKLRDFFYYFLKKISKLNLGANITGEGLYDKEVISLLRKNNDPFPLLRAMIPELGIDYKTIDFNQNKRKFGSSKNNFFSLFDLAITSVAKYSVFPVKFFINFGFICAFFSTVIATIFFLYKLFFWNSFDVGIAPIVIGVFFLSSIQIFILGLIGQYVTFVLQYQKNLPLVIEKERINF